MCLLLLLFVVILLYIYKKIVVVCFLNKDSVRIEKAGTHTTTTTAKYNDQLTKLHKKGPWRAVPFRLETDGNRDKTFITTCDFNSTV